MGLAKYYEDNMRIREERYLTMQEDEQRPIYRNGAIAKRETKSLEELITTTKIKKRKKDKQMLCCECNTAFVFTGSEQKYYEKHDLSKPNRCKTCRSTKKVFYF